MKSVTFISRGLESWVHNISPRKTFTISWLFNGLHRLQALQGPTQTLKQSYVKKEALTCLGHSQKSQQYSLMSSRRHKTGKGQFSFNPKERQCQCSNYHTIALISHASKVMLKILQARLQEYVNHELPDVQAGFRKGRGTRDQITNICWIIEKAKEFQKNIYFCFID